MQVQRGGTGGQTYRHESKVQPSFACSPVSTRHILAYNQQPLTYVHTSQSIDGTSRTCTSPTFPPFNIQLLLRQRPTTTSSRPTAAESPAGPSLSAGTPPRLDLAFAARGCSSHFARGYPLSLGMSSPRTIPTPPQPNSRTAIRTTYRVSFALFGHPPSALFI